VSEAYRDILKDVFVVRALGQEGFKREREWSP
jgi:hypothetical protein